MRSRFLRSAALVLLASSAALASPAVQPTVTATRPISAPTVIRPAHTIATVVLPQNGDVTPAATLTRAGVHIPITQDRVPLTVTPSEVLRFLKTEPFYCHGTDECRFTQMPYYNQINPNFAYVNVPASIYSAETKAPAGTVGPMPGTGQPALTILAAPGGVDPFYMSWLPYGPFALDDGWVSQLYMTSNICGPTAEAMALAGALSAKASSTRVLGGTFTSDRFVAATPYPGEAAVPTPLHHDGHSVATPPGVQAPSPTSWQMGAADIQRVVNMATLQKTDPTWGGRFDKFLSLQYDFNPTGVELSVYNPDAPALVSMLRQRHAVVITLGFYDVQITSSTTAGGNHQEVSFTRAGGHAMAVDGFTGADSGTPSFFLHDPWYGQPRMRSFIMFDNSERSPALGYQLPMNGSRVATFRYPNRVTPTRIRDLHDGDQIVFVEQLDGLQVD